MLVCVELVEASHFPCRLMTARPSCHRFQPLGLSQTWLNAGLGHAMDHQCGGSWFTAPWWCGLHFLLLEPFGLLLNRSTRASCGLREGGFNRLVKGGCMAALSGACRFESCTSDQTSELTLFQYGFYSQLSSRAISADYSIQTSVPAKSS